MTAHVNHRYAIGVERADGVLRCVRLDRTALTGLDEAVAAVRGAGSSGTAYGLFNADESFFLILRVAPGATALFLSDAGAAHRHTLAAQALDALRVAPPGDDAPGPRPAGDLGVLAGLGLGAEGMAAVLAGPDALPDTRLREIAERCGFTAAFDRLRR
ncbi:tRNA adenosine deaminase-associated protein [Streptomyces sp. NPDC048659]|uniref:tRNA adenosine deaminase-associated protein n=1 Tax=Streptomyces sp. NPDC048659 TaxID=3155489 RepID=UPI00342DB585